MPDATSILDPYRVQRGDTLSAIAKRCGRTVAELQHYNKIVNPNQLDVGQVLYLSKQSSFGVSVLFLDALRYPIENLPYRLLYDGKTLQGVTDSTGAVLDKIVTHNAQSQVEVWIKNADKQWQQISNTVSGYGHKLITLVSGFIVFKGQTEKLPDGAPAKPEMPLPPTPQTSGPQAPPPQKPTGAPSKNNPHVKLKKHKGPQGQSVITVGIDLPERLMQYFQNYTGEKITESLWEKTAQALQCEVGVLKAIGEVETKGAAFVRLNDRHQSGIIPRILYERHHFHRLTCANGPHVNTKHHKYHGKGVPGCHSPYDNDPDICYPSAFVSTKVKVHTPNKNMPDGMVEVTDQYGGASYLRLIKAYRLNPDAALQACSWGRFQVMGEEYHSSCGLPGVKDLVTRVCTSEVTQLEILRRFIENKAGGKLLKAVREKDWQHIALYYNGPGDVHNYSTKLEAAYEHIKKNTTA